MVDANWITLNPRTREAIRRAARETITQSEIMLRASCARKWFYRYACLLEKRGFFSDYLVYGSLMHRLLEERYIALAGGKEDALDARSVTDEMLAEALAGFDPALSPEQRDTITHVRTMVNIAFEAYCMKYREEDAKIIVLGVERQLRVTHEGLTFEGKIDLLARPHKGDGIFVYDFKTAGRIGPMTVAEWSFKFQFWFYAWLYWRATNIQPTGIVVQGLLKCALKGKKGESRAAFLERVRADFAENLDTYFYRERMPLTTGTLERFETEMLLPHVRAFRRLKTGGPDEILDPLALAMNTGECHKYGTYCEYLQLCKDGWLASGEYDAREEKHPELETHALTERATLV